MRGSLLEYGIPVRNGVGTFKATLPDILGNPDNHLSDSMRRLLTDMQADLRALEQRNQEPH